MKHFDIIIIGGGHAGVEAAYCASQFPIKIGLISLAGVGLASAPCNPSIGGIGKGQVVREIDALGGCMGILADKAGIQYRTLNESKGVAVQSTRVQIDKDQYSLEAENLISKLPNVEVLRDKVSNIIKNSDNNFLISTDSGQVFNSQKIILTTGTFMAGKLHCGPEIKSGGRVDVEPSAGILELFASIKMKPRRFKTGTPARIKKSSINFEKMVEQPSDEKTRNFHLWNSDVLRGTTQISCYLTRTTAPTMEIIRKNKEKSPMFNGQILAVGARYCPSIEDKAYRYSEKDAHHVFLEPEGLTSDSFYPSGISSSLPPDVQLAFIQTIPGLESAEIIKYGYAVEYDVVDTSELSPCLEYRAMPGLYFAGQMNGTSGYEEAAAQGLIAGFNAALAISGRKKLCLNRKESYIGVMIDDLVSAERDEPYRLFTARSENRLYLREDNSFVRMFPYRNAMSIASMHDESLKNLINEYDLMCKWLENLKMDSAIRAKIQSVYPNLNDLINSLSSVKELLKLPDLDPKIILNMVVQNLGIKISSIVVETVAIEAKYEGYINKATLEYARVDKLDGRIVDLEKILGSNNISFECKQRIEKFRPENFGQLKRLSGIRPATLAVVASGQL